MAMKICKECGSEVSSKGVCPKCGKDQRNFFVKHKILVFVLALILLCIISSNTNNTSTNTTTNEKYSTSKVEVTVVDFSTMSKEDVKNWCETNKIKYTIKDEYSNIVGKGSFVSQSVDANTIIYEGDKVIISYSLGKEPTTEEKNALKKAKSYSSTMHMSKKGIYNQLTSTAEGFGKEAAQYAIDNIEADWNNNALEKAKSYQSTLNMSKKAIYNQLISNVEGFTKEEAQYAIDHLDD